MYNQLKKDPDVFSILQLETERQRNKLELIASENFVSAAVLEAAGSILTNKYAEGYPGKRYYGGCEFVDMAEDLARDRLKKLFGANYVNVQPHSGSQANMAVLMSFLKPGDKFMGLSLAHGGHLTHGSPVNFSGQLYQAVGYTLNPQTKVLDYNLIEDLAKKEKPKLIITGASAYSRDWDYEKFRAIADAIGAYLMCDMAHPAGLVLLQHRRLPAFSRPRVCARNRNRTCAGHPSRHQFCPRQGIRLQMRGDDPQGRRCALRGPR